MAFARGIYGGISIQYGVSLAYRRVRAHICGRFGTGHGSGHWRVWCTGSAVFLHRREGCRSGLAFLFACVRMYAALHAPCAVIRPPVPSLWRKKSGGTLPRHSRLRLRLCRYSRGGMSGDSCADMGANCDAFRFNETRTAAGCRVNYAAKETRPSGWVALNGCETVNRASGIFDEKGANGGGCGNSCGVIFRVRDAGRGGGVSLLCLLGCNPFGMNGGGGGACGGAISWDSRGAV